MRPSSIRPFLRAALVAALISAGALVAIPVGPVPVTLQVLVVAIATLVLAPAEALLTIGLYLALGAVGAPVFSGGGAGLGVIAGPTGGFLIGFLVGSPLGASIRRSLGRFPVCADVAALTVLLVVTYGLGWAFFVGVTGRPPAEALALAVVPFVLVDIGKAVAAVLVARALRAAGLADAPAGAPVGL